ncbi:condensation domain-containing protein [Streptomyces sp. NPDC088194]|uniref:condensation domain-containing protein n=1 Tax=Streptomyces sp. NPDC088194 TaxID=3154931 RepID=UPI00344FFFB8
MQPWSLGRRWVTAGRRPRPCASHHALTVTAQTATRLREAARERRTTLLLGAFMHALAAQTGQDDLSVGSIFANRARPELQGTVGMFANLSVLRSRPAAHPLRCAADLGRKVFAALSHQQMHHGSLPFGTSAEAAHGTRSAWWPRGTGRER